MFRAIQTFVMRGSLLAVTSCLLAWLALPALAAPLAAPLAFITDLTGKVDVARVASKRVDPAVIGAALRKGDRILVARGAKATVLFKEGNLLELPGKSALTIGARPPAAGAGSGDDLMANVFESVSEGVVGGTRETGFVALAPARGESIRDLILAPRQCEILEDRPTLRWRPMSGAGRYLVEVSDDSGVLWRREVGSSELAFPADAPALRRGVDHLWELSVPGESGVVYRESSGFRVKSESEAESIRRHLARIEGSGASNGASTFLAGAYLAGQGLFIDAIQRFDALCRAHPDDPGPREALGQVYRAMGRSEDAAAEFQKALTLVRQP